MDSNRLSSYPHWSDLFGARSVEYSPRIERNAYYYWLYAIKHGDNYPTKTLDCNYIGEKEFYEILDDLKISGKSAPAQKLHAEKKA